MMRRQDSLCCNGIVLHLMSCATKIPPISGKFVPVQCLVHCMNNRNMRDNVNVSGEI